MKTIITFGITLLFVTTSYAQSLSVESFQLLEKDMTAKLAGTQKTDQNGEVAALIKVVTPEKGFTFEGGSMGIVATEQKTGEIWVYMPGDPEKITIKHQAFGVLRDYIFPVPVEGGRTYELLLDIGTGRYVTVTSSMEESDITIDGKYYGRAPLYNVYLNYGIHTIKAVGNKYEGELRTAVLVNDEKHRVINVEMKNASEYFGGVTVTAPNNAEILFQDKSVGTGEWTTSLREGEYSVQTYLPDCDTTTTTFTVTPQTNITVEAKAPVPHMGYLNLIYATHGVKTTVIGNQSLDLSSPQVPVGAYSLSFSRKGYVTQNTIYNVYKNQVTSDTITLDRIEYVKKLSFFLGASYDINEMSGLSGIIGAVVYKHDIQISYTFGLTSSKKVSWYGNDGSLLSTMNYKQNVLAFKYGYQFQFNRLRQLALTPQVGFASYSLNGNVLSGSTSYGKNASASALTLGLKLVMVPFQHCAIFVAPEYDVALSKNNTYTNISKMAGFNASRFSMAIGALFTF